ARTRRRRRRRGRRPSAGGRRAGGGAGAGAAGGAERVRGAGAEPAGSRSRAMAETSMAERGSDEVEKARTFLAGILQHMRIPAALKVSDLEDRLVIEIECEDEGDTQRVIGRRGQ